MKKLSSENIITAPMQTKDQINNYVFNQNKSEIDENRHYKVALVLGCAVREILANRTNKALNLYLRGIIKKIYLSGGVGKTSTNKKQTEAEVMKEILMCYGVPETDIVIEDKSTTTYENMINTLDLIKRDCGDDGEIVLITSDFHQKRSKAMISKMLDDINCTCKVYSYGTDDGYYGIKLWNKSFDTQKMIRIEALLLAFYTWRGKINDQNIEKVNVRTRE